jgi:predicted RNase H-like nuclease (RuvC/YqgF family)
LKVFGIDIIRGSVRSRTRRPVYALVVIEDGQVVSSSQVTAFRLSRLIAAEEPEILATDSVQELAPDQHDLVSFMQTLPTGTVLVQVTGGERKETLQKVAARYNIQVERTDPFAEAGAAARIAYLGGGAAVIAFEKTTEITVSRHRSPGKGGWSQNRYIRKMHGAVRERAREVEGHLVAAGLRYEKSERLAFGGFSRVNFTVYASRDEIPVRASAAADVQVRIEGRRLDRIRYEPLTKKPRYLIVGIDPGTTTGIGAVDLDGEVVEIYSSRQMGTAEIIEHITGIGKPLIIASDVQPMPDAVEKVRRAFNAIAYVPPQDRSVEGKLELTAGTGYANPHERDAVSAALDAYRSLKNKFQNIAKRVPPGIDLDEVRAGVLRGRSIEAVLADLSGRQKPAPAAPETPPPPQPTPPAQADERLVNLERQVRRLREFVQELEDGIAAKDREITSLKRQIRYERSERGKVLQRDTEITTREAIIANLRTLLRKEEKRNKSLRKRIERMQRVEELQIGEGQVAVKAIPSLTHDAVRSLAADLGLVEGDVVSVATTGGWGRSVVREIADAKAAAVVVPGESLEGLDPHLIAAALASSLPLMAAGAIGLRLSGKIGTADEERFTAALAAWGERVEENEREKRAAMLNQVFKEYRSEREKEVRRHG